MTGRRQDAEVTQPVSRRSKPAVPSNLFRTEPRARGLVKTGLRNWFWECRVSPGNRTGTSRNRRQLSSPAAIAGLKNTCSNAN